MHVCRLTAAQGTERLPVSQAGCSLFCRIFVSVESLQSAAWLLLLSLDSKQYCPPEHEMMCDTALCVAMMFPALLKRHTRSSPPCRLTGTKAYIPHCVQTAMDPQQAALTAQSCTNM